MAEESATDEHPGRVAQSDVKNRTGAMGLRCFRRMERTAAFRDFSWFMVKLKEPRGRSFRRTTSPRSTQATATQSPLLPESNCCKGLVVFCRRRFYVADDSSPVRNAYARKGRFFCTDLSTTLGGYNLQWWEGKNLARFIAGLLRCFTDCKNRKIPVKSPLDAG